MSAFPGPNTRLVEWLQRIPPSWLALAVIFPLALALRYPIADIPLERDEGGYAYVAQRWLRGDVPYKDSFETKPPALYVAYLLLLVTAGISPAAIHWLFPAIPTSSGLPCTRCSGLSGPSARWPCASRGYALFPANPRGDLP